MECIMIEAEAKLIQMASCLARFSKSWSGFTALRISYEGKAEGIHGSIFHPAKSIIDSYLGDVEGRSFYCEQGLHVICNGIPVSVLDEAGKQICFLLSGEQEGCYYYEVFNLGLQAEQYATLAEQDSNGALYFTSANKFLESMHLPINNLIENETRNKKDYSTKSKVLLIEDDPVTRWMVRSSLKNECEFACAPTAHKAFSMYSSFNPDLVFLDINLPDDTGYSVLQWIMHNDPGACVVMFSSNNSMINILESLEKGAMGFIAKPFLRENLMQYIHRETIN